MTWLGQAGFVLSDADHTVAVDPFLSDFPGRLLPATLEPRDLAQVDVILATHEHADHLDLAALAEVRRLSPRLPIVVPAPSWTWRSAPVSVPR